MLREINYFGLEIAIFGERSWIEDAAFTPGPKMNTERSFFGIALSGRKVVVFGGYWGTEWWAYYIRWCWKTCS